MGAESSTFSKRLSEAQKQQEEHDDSEEPIAFSKNLLAEKKKTKYVQTFTLLSCSISLRAQRHDVYLHSFPGAEL